MDFGVVTLEGMAEPETSNPKNHGSGFIKKERSEPGEENWRSSKSHRTDAFGAPKTMQQQQNEASLLRSNLLFSDNGDHNMLSFSSTNEEAPPRSKDAGLTEKATQNPLISFHQQTPTYINNAGYSSGGLGAGMLVPFARYGGPFTPSQWMELEHQALIYKHIVANVPIPSHLLVPLRKSLNLFSFSEVGWGTFHLGFSGNTDPEPGRCRRTDGKKWRCSKDAVPDQKYCERHINRGRHRSRKPVEGQNGHAVSGSTTSKVVPVASSPSASVRSCSGTSNSLGATQHQFKSLSPDAANPSTNTLVNRMQDPQGLSIVSPAINVKCKDSPFSIPKHVSVEESSQSEFGVVSSDSLLYPSPKSSYMNLRNTNSFLSFNDKESSDQPLRHFIDEWPKGQSGRATVGWPEELKSDWTQLSMSIPMASSDFSSSSNSPTQDKLTLSPLGLSREFDPIQMGLGARNEHSEPMQKQTNWIPISWENSMGGPLGEVLNHTSSTGGASKNSSAPDLTTEMWDGSPQLGSSPTGVLQKASFVSLSNSSSGSSPRANTLKVPEGGSLCSNILSSALTSTSSVPSSL
ncbi:hypothetical protein RJ640_030604 [Escallonia rubra]|uniref:Growth-regulating factor n=1 Tax=Escallonia rubra TaxID=112253 RepID=A0AA88RFG4_9ASTE|nr:hypothetical protein RJ640_030604 [Escallonia rubra]